MPGITPDQLKQLQDMVTALVADKSDADGKTQASNVADTAAQQATAAAAQAKLDEAASDGKVTTDLTALQQFIDALAGLPAPNP